MKHTLNYGIVFNGQNIEDITYTLYTDASFASKEEQRKSITGFISLIAGGCIGARSSSQDNITISTAEAELNAVNEGVKESEFLWHLLGEIGFTQKKPITIHCDNQAAISIIQNPGNFNATKHIEIKHLYIRQLQEKKRVNVIYCKSEDQVADILTKALPTEQFKRLREMMGVKPTLPQNIT